MKWVPWIIVGVNAVASIFWGVAARRAYKAQIAAKDAQIDSLKELTSVQVREHYLAMKAQLEEYIEQLKKRNEELQAVLKNADADLEKLGRELRIWQEIQEEAEEKLRVLKRDFREKVGRPHSFDSTGILAEHMVKSGIATQAEIDRMLGGSVTVQDFAKMRFGDEQERP